MIDEKEFSKIKNLHKVSFLSKIKKLLFKNLEYVPY